MKSHLYHHLSRFFYEEQYPENYTKGMIILRDEELSRDFPVADEIILGQKIPEDLRPIALAYGGHQFGHYTRLGDGRAVLLGEIEKKGILYDIQLKGSGRTAFSRRGDGKGTYSSMVREYIHSHFMNAMGIPSTMSLAVGVTGEEVYRRMAEEGGVLCRIATSHIRIGTFEYAYEAGGIEKVKELADYVRSRYYPDKDYLSLLEEIGRKQARMIAHWMAIGFIHGVMNTDNMSIVGETIDYGPCAYMERYVPSQVFSSIDTFGRYAYDKQGIIGQWNYSRLAIVLLELIEQSGQGNRKDVQQLVDDFIQWFQEDYQDFMAEKIGFHEQKPELVREVLELMEIKELDYTETFVKLMEDRLEDPWVEKWKKEFPDKKLMEKVNPRIIPRNKVVEELLERRDPKEIEEYLRYIKNPYGENIPEKFQKKMTKEELRQYQTFCGT
ncbi:MAG: protein adenylyltransferase SelO family protein [Tissierellia bacterium]|nr:protein adenylyltransferase SelO family protein [Tissierellia bacterium]